MIDDLPKLDVSFDGFAFYSVDPSVEELRHETVAEAIAEHLGGRVFDAQIVGSDVVDAIAALCPIEVHGYVRESLSADFGMRHAEGLVESIEENWIDEYGGEDSPFSQEALDTLASKLAPIIQDFAASVPVWRCEVAASKRYVAEEVIELMREECPSWFAPATPPAAAPGPDAPAPPDDGGDGLCC